MKFGIIIAAGVLALGASAFAQLVPGAPANGWGKDISNYAVATGGPWALNNVVYVVPAYGWSSDPSGGSEFPGFTVTADIEMWASFALTNQAIYFHIGQNPGANPSMTASIGGSMVSNHGQWLTITTPGNKPTKAKLDNLEWVNNPQGQTRDAGNQPSAGIPANIPVTWAVVSGTSGPQALAYSGGGNDDKLWGYAWLADGGTAGAHSFAISCTITPAQYQPDGHYQMDPIIVASPEL